MQQMHKEYGTSKYTYYNPPGCALTVKFFAQGVIHDHSSAASDFKERPMHMVYYPHNNIKPKNDQDRLSNYDVMNSMYFHHRANQSRILQTTLCQACVQE